MRLDLNTQLEFQRNAERYAFLRWGQTAFQNFKVVRQKRNLSPSKLEYLARVLRGAIGQADLRRIRIRWWARIRLRRCSERARRIWLGRRGIEAEAAMLRSAKSMLVPAVVGFKLHGKLPGGATATDLV